MDIKVLSATVIDIIFKGGIVPFNKLFNETSFKSLYLDAKNNMVSGDDLVDPTTGKFRKDLENYRVQTKVDISVATNVAAILDVLGPRVLANTVMVYGIRGAIEEDSAVERFVAQLETLEHTFRGLEACCG